MKVFEYGSFDPRVEFNWIRIESKRGDNSETHQTYVAKVPRGWMLKTVVIGFNSSVSHQVNFIEDPEYKITWPRAI